MAQLLPLAQRTAWHALQAHYATIKTCTCASYLLKTQGAASVWLARLWACTWTTQRIASPARPSACS